MPNAGTAGYVAKIFRSRLQIYASAASGKSGTIACCSYHSVLEVPAAGESGDASVVIHTLENIGLTRVDTHIAVCTTRTMNRWIGIRREDKRGGLIDNGKERRLRKWCPLPAIIWRSGAGHPYRSRSPRFVSHVAVGSCTSSCLRTCGRCWAWAKAQKIVPEAEYAKGAPGQWRSPLHNQASAASEH